MSASVLNTLRRRQVWVWMTAAAVCLIFTLLYNTFGHGVTSPWMNTLCLWPLGTAAFYFLFPLPGRLSRNLLNAGVATAAAGSLLMGVMAIAGADTGSCPLLLGVGLALMLAGLVTYNYRRPRPAHIAR